MEELAGADNNTSNKKKTNTEALDGIGAHYIPTKTYTHARLPAPRAWRLALQQWIVILIDTLVGL
jgi:hypothetical protein